MALPLEYFLDIGLLLLCFDVFLNFWSLMFSRRKVFSILKSETGIDLFLCLAISQK